MILDVTYRYAAKLIPFQKRNPIDVRFIDTIAVEVRELEEIEAPLAFRYQDPERYLDPGEPSPENSLIDVRKIGGGLFEPYILRDSARDPYRSMGASDLVEAAKSAYLADRSGFDPFDTATMNHYSRDSRIEDFPRSKPVSSARDSTIQAIHDRAASLVLVGGRLYKSTTEPVYSQRSMRGYVVIERLNRDLRAEKRSCQNLFRADEFDQIGLREDAEGIHRIEVLDPSAITFRGPELAMVEQAASLLESLKRGLPDTTVEKFARYVDLREILRRVDADPSGPSQDSIDAVVEVVRRIQENDLEDSYWMQAIDRSLARLDASTMRSLATEGLSP